MTIETACGGFALQQFDSDRKLLNVGVIDCAIALKHRPIWVTSARQRGTAWHQPQWRLLSSVPIREPLLKSGRPYRRASCAAGQLAFFPIVQVGTLSALAGIGARAAAGTNRRAGIHPAP